MALHVGLVKEVGEFINGTGKALQKQWWLHLVRWDGN
jgi:hypothetical protein